MSKRTTAVFDDEELYTALKIEAARMGWHSEAVRECFEDSENRVLRSELEEAHAEWEDRGGVEATEFFRNILAGRP